MKARLVQKAALRRRVCFGCFGEPVLISGLQFTAQALRRSVDSDEELSVSFTKAYEVTLRAHHSFVVRPIFAVAMKACPYRKDFYAKLGEPREQVDQNLRAWLEALEKIVREMQQFYEYVRYLPQARQLYQGPVVYICIPQVVAYQFVLVISTTTQVR